MVSVAQAAGMSRTEVVHGGGGAWLPSAGGYGLYVRQEWKWCRTMIESGRWTVQKQRRVRKVGETTGNAPFAGGWNAKASAASVRAAAMLSSQRDYMAAAVAGSMADGCGSAVALSDVRCWSNRGKTPRSGASRAR